MAAASLPDDRAPQVRTARSLLFTVLAVLALAVLAWIAIRGPAVPDPLAPVTTERALRFTDLSNGAVRVQDARSGRTVALIEGEAGFARGTLRSLVRERRRTGASPSDPFVLSAHADGRLTLSDPSTGQQVDLGSFGPTNAGVFARMLASPGESS